MLDIVEYRKVPPLVFFLKNDQCFDFITTNFKSGACMNTYFFKSQEPGQTHFKGYWKSHSNPNAKFTWQLLKMNFVVRNSNTNSKNRITIPKHLSLRHK